MSLADTYVTMVVQPLEALEKRPSPEFRKWVLETKLSTANAAYTDAVNPNEVVAMIDLVTFIALRRHAYEEHWLPDLVKKDDVGLLDAYKRGEALAWETAERLFTHAQVDELRTAIDEWVTEHPGQYYVSNIRLSEFAAQHGKSLDSKTGRMPNSLFSLLYIDPLANLDPIARELAKYRDVTERMNYLLQRFPVMLGWQVDLTVLRAMSSYETERFYDETSRLVTIADNLTKNSTTAVDTVARLPDVISSERKAAIDQISENIQQQQGELFKNLTNQQEQARALLVQARGIVSEAREISQSAKGIATDSIDHARLATTQIIDRVFIWLGSILVVCILLVRLLRRRDRVNEN